MNIILASQSPRRKQLLEWAEIPFEIKVSDVEEDFPAHLKLEQVAEFIAQKKAKAVFGKSDPAAVVLAADTIVICKDEILGKPQNENDAFRMLKMLSGITHQVITGVVLINQGVVHSFSDTTSVTFNSLSDAQIEYYIKKYKPFDKAGSYAIQEWIGVIGIKCVNGDFYNVMGLPISRVVQLLSSLGYY